MWSLDCGRAMMMVTGVDGSTTGERQGGHPVSLISKETRAPARLESDRGSLLGGAVNGLGYSPSLTSMSK